MSALEGTSIIGFRRAEKHGARFTAVNPATNEPLKTEFVAATLDDLGAAARLASDAAPALRDASGAWKATLLRAIAVRLEEAAETIVPAACEETALPMPRIQSELGRTCAQLRLFAALVEEGSWVGARIDHADPMRMPAARPDVRSMLRPLGPVAVFGASNFPLAFSVAGGDTASALAAGCPVIAKAHPAHPGTSELAGIAIQSACRDTGAPDGTFSLLFDQGFAVGVALVQHPSIKAVGFTGSRRGGTALVEAAARRADPIPVYAEMGSVNPVVILPGAMRARGAAIAAGLQGSVTLGVGQFCTNPGLVFIERSAESDAFLDDLEARMDGCAAGVMLTGPIGAAYRDGAALLRTTAGVSTRSARGAEAGVAALFVTDARTLIREPRVRAELFGPSTVVVQCAGRRELLDAIATLEGQLTATVHADAGELDHELLALLESKAGRLVVNGFPTGVEVSHAMVHGGPWPATSDGRSTSVGTRAIERFTRPVCYQDVPDDLLPPELRESNPLAIHRLVDGEWK